MGCSLPRRLLGGSEVALAERKKRANGVQGNSPEARKGGELEVVREDVRKIRWEWGQATR